MRLLPPEKKDPSIVMSRNRYRAICAGTVLAAAKRALHPRSRGWEFVNLLLMPVPGLLLTSCKYSTAPRNYRCIRKRFCVSLLEGNTTPFHHTHTPTSNIPYDDTQDSLPASSLSGLPSFFLSLLLFFSFFFLFLFPLPPQPLFAKSARSPLILKWIPGLPL